ncbi:acyltransferase family protein [Pantoea agglomerans]|uniref:Acyltransferase n=1 Tax=Enterobacter agglomerans TaxID=549 RepID=A0ACC5RH04_ENTAG|nr:acyltransferase [Pantoea agglomerans]MBK4723893.1 acyltransferase [Pantoea agglomerans]
MRIQSIDYLRGLMSVSIVLYHFSTNFTTWGMTDSGTTLGRLGIYAVSAFYIISGMALYLSHKEDGWDLRSYGRFMSRRFMRLAPVYWIGLLFLIIYSGGLSSSTWKYAQNFLLIFGVINPSGYLLMGGWSIGNEVVFYLAFPIFLLAARNGTSFKALFLLSFLLFTYCAFFYLSRDSGLDLQWSAYINPINQVYFFVLGVCLAKVLLPYVGRYRAVACIGSVLSFLAFIFYPVTGDQIEIIVGWNKFYFTMVIALLCAMFFLMVDLKNIPFLHAVLSFMGNISYPLYLLHGVSFLYFRRFFYHKGISDSDLIFRGLVLLSFLIFISWLCHIKIEKPVIKFSKSLLVRNDS